ncbi:MAG: M20/M25/M40 family metallo-hydrolase, partial [Clostridia bacterium]
MTDLLVWLDKAMAERETIVSLRRELHMHPECAFKEYETARLIREALSDIGLPYREVGSGTVADIPAAPGKNASLIALRADIDALPIEEKTDLPFSSVNPGMMHACGHDAHTAMLLGAARLLWLNRDMLPGPVRL